ncbi:unnamed protein product, partial [Closterium sp. NIES-65]
CANMSSSSARFCSVLSSCHLHLSHSPVSTLLAYSLSHYLPSPHLPLSPSLCPLFSPSPLSPPPSIFTSSFPHPRWHAGASEAVQQQVEEHMGRGG